MMCTTTCTTFRTNYQYTQFRLVISLSWSKFTRVQGGKMNQKKLSMYDQIERCWSTVGYFVGTLTVLYIIMMRKEKWRALKSLHIYAQYTICFICRCFCFSWKKAATSSSLSVPQHTPFCLSFIRLNPVYGFAGCFWHKCVATAGSDGDARQQPLA